VERREWRTCGGSCAASVTTGAEHPLIFPLTATGVWGHPPDKQLNAVNQPTSFGNVVGKQGTGEEETRILAAAPVAPHPILLQKIMTCDERESRGLSIIRTGSNAKLLVMGVPIEPSENQKPQTLENS
jgi:hypothetical protein